MFRFFSLIARRPGVTEQEFHDHWRYPHGAMGRRIAGLRDYVQAHRLPSPALDDNRFFQGVAISGFDTVEAAKGLLTDRVYLDLVRPDEPSFQDLPRNVFFCTEEEVLQTGPANTEGAAGYWSDLDLPVSVQLLQFIRTTGSHDWAQSDDLALGHALGAFRHTRNQPATAWHGVDVPFLGVRQLWSPTLTAFDAARTAAPDAWQDLQDRTGPALQMLVSRERWLR